VDQGAFDVRYVPDGGVKANIAGLGRCATKSDIMNSWK
jgi:hypothetical protein